MGVRASSKVDYFFAILIEFLFHGFYRMLTILLVLLPYLIMDKTSNDINKKSRAKFSVEELVENTDSADVKAFLIDLLKDDPMLLQQFKLKIHYGISTDDLKIYQHEVDTICKRYADKYGYISYSASRGFHNELSEVLQNTIMKIIDNKEYGVALQLIRYVFITLGKINIDDSDGTLGELADDCITLLQTILGRCDQKIKKILYQECKSLLMNDDMLDYLQDYIENMLFSDFTEDEFLHDKLIFSGMPVDVFLQSEENFSDKYAAEIWAKHHLQVMKQLKKDIRGIDALYAYDGLYDRLLKLSLETDELYYIFKYEDVIRDLAPQEILKRYEGFVRKKSAYTSDRSTYQEIAGLLKKMQGYPSGKELVQTLIAEFRVAYRRRPAMMQALDNV